MYTVIVAAATDIQAALHQLETAVGEQVGWKPCGGVSLTIAPPHSIRGFELREGVIFIFSQGMTNETNGALPDA